MIESEIYVPAEDSYLMSNVLKKEIPKLIKQNPDLKFLEIGCGSGIQLETAFSSGVKKENIFSVDINPQAVNHCKKLGFNVIKSGLFKEIKKEKKFDIIIFNPPYLPTNKKEPKNSRINTTAGKKGNEIIIRFLNQAKKHLNNKGKIFLITSSLSEDIDFKSLGYKAKEISTKNLFFEKLICWECLNQ